MRAQRTAPVRIMHGSPSKRKARTPTAPAGHLLAAPRWCAACGHGIAADKGNSFVRHARTAHRAGAHYAWLTLKEGGKNSRRPLGSLCEGAGWAAKLHRLRELLPPPLRGTSLSEGGKVIWRPCCQFRPRGRLPSAAVLNLRIPALLRKGEIARAKMLRSARYRGKPRTEHSDCGVFLKLTEFLFVSSKRNS